MGWIEQWDRALRQEKFTYLINLDYFGNGEKLTKRKSQIVFKTAPTKFVVRYGRGTPMLYYGCEQATIGREHAFSAAMLFFSWKVKHLCKISEAQPYEPKACFDKQREKRV